MKKPSLKSILKNRLRCTGMEVNDANISRLLQHVVEKTQIEAFLKAMTSTDVFQACQPPDSTKPNEKK